MNSRTKALALLSIVTIAAVAGSLIFAMQSVKADTTAIVASDSESTLSAVNATGNDFDHLNNGFMISGEHRGMRRGFEGFGGLGGFGQVQVSTEYTQNVTNIANADTDVQNLLNQGYNITSIHPVINTVVDANGNVVTKASKADLTLQGTNGRAVVIIDLDQAKVTKIVTLTVTEINK
jgi:hypothetical protein